MSALSGLFKNIPELELDEPKKRILFLYAAGLLVIVGVYFYFFLRPSLGALFELIPEVRKIKSEMKVVNDDLGFEDKYQKSLRAQREKMKNYEMKLSREKELPLLLEGLSKLARDSRVKIIGITPIDKALRTQKKEDKESIYQEVPIVINAQSGYHALGTFLNKLENAERYMQISDIKIRANKSNPHRHDIEFVVYAYTFKGEE